MLDECTPLVIVGSIIYVILCKVLYNTLVAGEDERMSDVIIAKTLVIAVLAALAATYLFVYYQRTPVHPQVLGQPPVVSRRISSLVPTVD